MHKRFTLNLPLPGCVGQARSLVELMRLSKPNDGCSNSFSTEDAAKESSLWPVAEALIYKQTTGSTTNSEFHVYQLLGEKSSEEVPYHYINKF